jgi:Fe-S-cluster containining protein
VTSPFADVPAALRALVPEAGDAWPDEPRAACGACPMVASTAPHPWSFAADIRCCGFHPTVPSYDVGRALARDPQAAALVRRRLADREGVSALGITAPPARERLYRIRGVDSFGRDPELRCPFWVGGEHACGIWAERPATCRVWYCKHDGGHAGAVSWTDLGALVSEAEGQLAALIAARGAPPAAGADDDAWIAWFGWCAAEVERVDAAALAALITPAMADRRAAVRAMRDRRARRLADVLVPSIAEWLSDDGRVWLTGYSSYDGVAAPPGVFALLARLDGVMGWREALAAARAETGDAGLDEALIVELHRVGALSAADGSDDLRFDMVPVRGGGWARPAGGER